MGAKSNAHRGLVGKPEEKGLHAKTLCKQEDNIKMHRKEIKWKGMECINMAQERHKWWAVAKTVRNFQDTHTHTHTCMHMHTQNQFFS
jgi:hypothetical protein